MTTTRDPAELEELQYEFNKAVANVEAAIKVYGRERTFESYAEFRRAWVRKRDVMFIQNLARKYPTVEIETLMERVIKADLFSGLMDPTPPS